MAKDTEKLIRQLSLISYLMAERRPVTAPEIRRDVEGYSVMNEDAFARRFYADRSELEALGIVLAVEKPVDGLVEQENYSLPPENFHLPPIAFTDKELAALRTALQLLDGEFAYAEPLRLALQQISWGRPSPLAAPEQSTVALGITGAAGGHEVSHRLAKIETAIFRRKTIVFDYHTMERDDVRRAPRRSLPAALPGRPVLRRRPLARAQRDQGFPAVADPRQGRLRDQGRARLPAPGELRPARVREPDRLAVRRAVGTAEVWISERIAWQIERHFGRYGEMRPATDDGDGGDLLFVTQYANSRQLIAWALGLGDNARIVGPPELVSELRDRLSLLVARHAGDPQIADTVGRLPGAPPAPDAGAPRRTRARRRQRQSPRRRDPPRALRAAGDAGEHPDRRRTGRPAAERERDLRRAEDLRAGAARGHLGAQRRQLRRRHVRAVRRDPHRRHDRGRPRAVRRFVRAPGAPAAGRGEGARRGDRPDRRAHSGGVARLGAREGGRRARRGSRSTRACSSRRRAATTPRSRPRCRARSPRGGCCRSSTTRRTRTSSRPGWSSRTR